MEWKYLFDRVILQRGRDYFNSGAVKKLRIKKDGITAEVTGNEAYDVEIEIEDGDISEMYCDCPYADEGNYCKHMAAVMFAVENKGSSGVKKESEADINDLIDSAKPEKLRSFLKDAIKDDEDLEVRLQAYLTPRSGKINMAANKRLVDNIADEFTRYDSYITYKYTGSFIEEMGKILSRSVEPMMRSERLEEAFELLGYVFIKTTGTDMDDDGELSYFADECTKLWRDIIAEADIKQKEKFFDWFVKHIDGSLIDYMEDELISALMNFFDEKEFMEKKLEFSQRKAEQIARADSYGSEFERERWTMLHIGLMEKTGASDENVLAYCKEHWTMPKVRKYCIERSMKHRKYSEAAEILIESLEIDKGKGGLITAHRQKLKEIYKRQKKGDLYREQLWILLTELNAGVEEYRELKALYSPEEWLRERERILTDSKNYQKPDLFREEKLWNRLLDFVISSKSSFTLQKYESDLVKFYPQEILGIYFDQLMSSARNKATRDTYRRWADTLRHMKTIKGGSAVVNDIIAQWRVLYKNRPAMMQELDEVTAPKPKVKKRKLK